MIGVSPTAHLRSVDLPAPFRPISATTSPEWIASETFLRMLVVSYEALTFFRVKISVPTVGGEFFG